MKRLVIVGGTMGVGKTTTCKALKRRLAPCAFLDVRLEILKMMEEYRDEIEEFKDGEGYQYCETSSDRYDYVTSNYGKIGEYCADNDRLTRAFGLDQEWEI